MTTFPLRKLVNNEQWEAEEELTGRLGILAHAAFLRAGFVPYGDEPSSGHLLKQADEVGPSAPRLFRLYTAPQLDALREGVDVAVLELRALGKSTIAFRAYLLTKDGVQLDLSCEAVLCEATLVPLLCCSLDDAARALETGSAGAWLWKSLADCVAPTLLHELCRRNDLPVIGFASLPDDAKVEILKRLTDGKDLARVECASRPLRRLVAERDGEIWKAMYDSLGSLAEAQSSESESVGLGSWKERYMEARRRRQRRSLWDSLFESYDEELGWLEDVFWRMPDSELEFSLHREREAEDRSNVFMAPAMESTGWRALRRRDEREADRETQVRRVFVQSPFRRLDPLVIPTMDWGFAFTPYMVPEDPLLALPPEPEELARGKNAGRRRRKVQQNDYQKKRHGAGAIHSPSSRYKWKHR